MEISKTLHCCQSEFTIAGRVQRLVCSKTEAFFAMLKHFENRAHFLTQKCEWSDLLALPSAAPEEDDADGGDGAFGDDDGPRDAAGTHAERDRQKVGQGNLHQPEADEIHNGGSDGSSRAVEGLEHNHAVGLADVAVAENA